MSKPTNMIEFTCQQCGKKFYRTAGRVRVQMNHFGTKPKFCCKECLVTYQTEHRKKGDFADRCKSGNYDLSPMYKWMVEDKKLSADYVRTSIYIILKCLNLGYTIDDIINTEDYTPMFDKVVKATHTVKTYTRYRGCVRNLAWYVSINGKDNLIISGGA